MARSKPPSTDNPVDLIAGAEPQDAPDMRRGGDARRHDEAGVEPGGHGYVIATLPDECPVTPLGHKGQINFFLDYRGQLIPLGTDFRKGEVMQLFGNRMGWLIDVFPQYGKPQGAGPAPCVGFDQKRVQEALIMKCAERGIFDPTGRVRGRGAHRGPGGELYLHCGNAVFVAGERTADGTPRKQKVRELSTGLQQGLVFPTEPAIDKPDLTAAPVEVGQELLELFRSWNWKNPYYAHLIFCWTATAMLGGALKHRPSIWINGPSGAGKTTLQQLIRDMMGQWAIATEDATEAGLRQLLNQDTLAVLFDEIEPDEGNAHVHMKIIKLARLAYSGGEALRGSQDHKSQSFQARSCFLFSSIHHHQLPAQDRNRMAIVHLSKFPPRTPMKPFPKMVKLWGNQIRRRLAEQWHRFPETLDAYAMAMMAEGMSGREQDTYATLLACGDLLLADAAPSWADAEAQGQPCRTAEHVRHLAGILDQSRGETEDTTERCLRYLTSHRLPAKSGEDQLTLGRWITRAMIAVFNSGAKGDHAAQKLRTYGVKLVHHEAGKESAGVDAYLAGTPVHVAIAGATHKAMLDIFSGSMWQGGVWTQSLALTEGAVPARKARFDGQPHRCILIPLEQMIDVQAAREEAADVAAARLAG